jgi:hypothetical protein
VDVRREVDHALLASKLRLKLGQLSEQELVELRRHLEAHALRSATVSTIGNEAGSLDAAAPGTELHRACQNGERALAHRAKVFDGLKRAVAELARLAPGAWSSTT